MRMQSPFFVLFLTLCHPLIIWGQPSFTDISENIGTIEKGGQNIGVSICDFNNDFLEDLYFVSRVGPNHFYKNLGNGIFVEQAEAMGLDFHGHSRMATWGDLNNDGWEDLYLGNLGQRNVLYQNNGDGTFSNITIAANITNDGRVYSVNMVDINKDGWLDIYISNSSSDNVLYINNGTLEISFTDYTQEAGLLDTRHCMGAVFFDMDNDGDEDLYVTHDAYISNTLYENDGTGHFTEIAKQAGVDYEGFGMGVDAGDLNNDGYLDLYVTNLYENVLYINEGNNTFSDYTEIAKVGDIGMGWGASIFDYDNDGKNDIYVGNDSYFYPIPNYLFDNRGNFKFAKVDTTAAISSMQGTYGVATGDLNNDGVQEVALANIGTKDHAQLLENKMESGYWIGFQLEGVQSNRSAIGTRMEIIDNRGDLHVDQITAGNGYAGQNTKRLHFGFNQVAAIKQVKVIWTNGLIQEWAGLPLGNYYYLKEGGEPEDMTVNLSTSTKESITDIQLSIFPNPTQQYLHITFPTDASTISNLNITNSSGQIIYQQLTNFHNSLSLDLKIHKGLILVTYEVGSIKKSKKILIL